MKRFFSRAGPIIMGIAFLFLGSFSGNASSMLNDENASVVNADYYLSIFNDEDVMLLNQYQSLLNDIEIPAVLNIRKDALNLSMENMNGFEVQYAEFAQGVYYLKGNSVFTTHAMTLEGIKPDENTTIQEAAFLRLFTGELLTNENPMLSLVEEEVGVSRLCDNIENGVNSPSILHSNHEGCTSGTLKIPTSGISINSVAGKATADTFVDVMPLSQLTTIEFVNIITKTKQLYNSTSYCMSHFWNPSALWIQMESRFAIEMSNSIPKNLSQDISENSHPELSKVFVATKM
jgi:hypothetical protein